MEATCETPLDNPSTVSDSSNRSREESIQYHLEYYFSEENLVKDRYLKGLMDSEGFVPISALATFNKMIALRALHSDIADAARKSPLMRLDEPSLRIRAYSLDYIVELKGIDDHFETKDVWAEVLTPNGISQDQCKIVVKVDNRWNLYTDDKLTAIDFVSKLRDFEARLRHRIPSICHTRRQTSEPRPSTQRAEAPVPQINPMFFPVNRFMPGFFPFVPQGMPPYLGMNSQRQPLLVPMGNRMMFQMPMNPPDGFRQANIPNHARQSSSTGNPNDVNRGNHYYTEEARETNDDPFEGFIRHKRPNRGHRQRQNAGGSWRAQPRRSLGFDDGDHKLHVHGT